MELVSVVWVSWYRSGRHSRLSVDGSYGVALNPLRNYSELIHYGMIAGKGTCQNGTRLKGNYGSGGEGTWGGFGFELNFSLTANFEGKESKRLPIDSILDVSDPRWTYGWDESYKRRKSVHSTNNVCTYLPYSVW